MRGDELGGWLESLEVLMMASRGTKRQTHADELHISTMISAWILLYEDGGVIHDGSRARVQERRCAYV